MPKTLTNPSHVFSAEELSDLCAKGRKIKKYQIVKTSWNNQPIAIKRYRIKKEAEDQSNSELADADERSLAFHAELEIFTLLDNTQTNFIKCFGHGTYRDTRYVYNCLVMPFLTNGDLYHFIEGNNCLSWRNRLSMMKGMAKALTYLHGKNYVHDDIKSLNFLVTDKFKIRLADFESTIQVDQVFISSCTFLWRAPELFDDIFEDVTFACDVYSLTTVYRELAAWKHPFQVQESEPALTKEQFFLAIKKEPREPIPADCPPGLARLITWGWKVDPKARPTSRQMLDEIKTIAYESNGCGR